MMKITERGTEMRTLYKYYILKILKIKKKKKHVFLY